MTDFGIRSPAGGATKAEQDETQAKLDALHIDITVTLVAILAQIITELETLTLGVPELTAQATNTFLDAVVFDTTAETYTATGIDVSAYRDFLLLIALGVTDAPGDIQIQVRFSDDDTTYYQLMNGPFGDIRYEDLAGNKIEALVGKCLSNFMDIHVISSGCSATHKFTLTVKAILTR